MAKKVLIIEDEDNIARMYEKALTADGFAPIVAVGGADGLAKVKSEHPDIVLLDIMMPEPDGIEVLEKIKSDPDVSMIPVVMLSNLSGAHDAELAKSKGARDYWLKSAIDVKELSSKVNSILNSEGSSGN